MAPEKAVTLTEAQTRAIEGNVESQDSQAVMAAMHQLHGIGVRSSSPIDPLEYDEDLIQRMMQHPRPPKVHQQHVGNAHDATASAASQHVKARAESKSKLESKSISNTAHAKEKANKNPGQSNRDKNPAVTATTLPGNKGSSAQPVDKGLDSEGPGIIAVAGASGAAPPAPTAPNPIAPDFISSSQARSTNASNHRVFDSHCHQPASSRHPSRGPTHSRIEVTLDIVSIDQTNLPTQSQSQPNETIPSSLKGAAPVGSQTSSPTRVFLGNDAYKTQGSSSKSRSSVTSIFKTYSRKRRGKKMASSPQSSTQSNDERSYEQYLPRGDDLIASDPSRQSRLAHGSPSPGKADATTQDEDTALVELDYSEIDRLDTQPSLPDSARTGPATQHQQHANSDYVFGNPETPAAPRNPFLGSRSAALMASSQMFMQNSSAFKATFSPTSSRPSPDNLHLNSISPNPSPLKRVTTGFSPLHGASSLPQLPLGYDTSPQQPDENGVQAHDEDEIARSPISKSFHFPPHVPIEEYRPVQRWEIRAVSAQDGSDMDNNPDEDMSDEEERRRHRAALIRAKAQKRLKSIPFERKSEEAVVPATHEERMSPAAQRYLDQCDGVSRRDSQSSIEHSRESTPDVVDSQDGVVQLSADLPGHTSAGGHNSSNDVVPNTDPGPTSAPVPTDEEPAMQIPETSPPPLRPIGELMPHSSDEVSKPGSFSKLLSSPLAAITAETPAELPAEEVFRTSQQQVRDDLGAEEDDSDSEAGNGAHGPCVIVSSSPPAPAFSTRARLRGGKPLATAPPTSASTSPLSRLTTTPALSNGTTPLTEESPRDGPSPSSTLIDAADSSPAVAKARRQHVKNVPKAAPSKLQTSTRRSARQSFPPNVSMSTDELAGSPRSSTPTFEQGPRTSRLGRTLLRESPTSRNTSRSGAKIFTGMAFAVSFQGKKSGESNADYKARMANSDVITTKIKQAGGKVLSDGFDHLFEFIPVKNADREASAVSSTPQPDDDIALVPQARDIGFTALIADGHSRKVKYMQALALGLPCIHERWITACIGKHYLVDWADYLLCAGNSSFLGDAIRSRNLSTYDAATARLSEVIQHRPRLLDQSRILLLMTRADESRKEAYVFLARVLGASLSRVYTVEEARRQLKVREDAGRAFDWVYVVDEKVDAEKMFVSPAIGAAGGSRKRKRRSGSEDAGASTVPPAKRVRALSDELVIQSLILGRLMEESEMKATAA